MLLRTRFPSLEAFGHGEVPRQVGLVAPRNCLNLYASVWILPEFEAIGCSNATLGFGKIAGDGFQSAWNGPDGAYAQARRSLRRGEVPEPYTGCIYTGSFFS